MAAAEGIRPAGPRSGTPDAAAVARMFEGLLWATHLSVPDDLGAAAAAHAAEAGLHDLVLYLVDLEQGHLVPIPGAPARRAENGVLRIEGTVPGRCFATQQIIALDIGDDDRRQLWVPLVDGTERVGVMVLDVPAPAGEVDPRIHTIAERYGHLCAQLVMSKGTYGDAFELVRRRQPMSVAAELQRQLVPPMATATEGLVISGMIEPCYHAGGDSFDYAINGTTAHLAVFDAMGHGLAAAATASVTVAAYRNSRRRGLDLVASYGAIDDTLRDQFAGERFTSAVLGRLDVTTGAFHWVNAGHPAPLLIRGGRLVKVLDAPAATALGVPFGDPPPMPAHEALEPGDRILIYTDGVIESRTPEGLPFTAERLVEFIERESDTGNPAPETLRRLRHAIMGHQQGRLQDDATVMLCEWRRGTEKALIPGVG